MKVYSAICIEDWEISAENGDHMKCKRGEQYTVTGDRGNGQLTVFGPFWVEAPTRIFAGFTTLRGEKVAGVPLQANK